MKRTRAVILVALAGLVFTTLYLTQMPRYRAEDNALNEMATLSQAPVKYVRVEGVSGFQYVNTVWLQPLDPAVLLAVDLQPQFNALPRLQTICLDRSCISEAELNALRDRYPQIDFSTKVGFSWKPRFRFAHPEPRS